MERPTKQDLRRTRFKKAIDPDEARRKREDHFVEIRKAKREENLMKRRRRRTEPSSQGLDAMDDDAVSEMVALRAKMPEMAKGVLSDDVEIQTAAIQDYRKLLSIERTPPIKDVIKQGVVPKMVTFLDCDNFPTLQFEASWCLTNIASGTTIATQTVVDAGAVPRFIRLLSSPDAEVRDQAVWALGNISGDSTRTRDMVLDLGALKPLLNLLNQNSDISLLRNATWALSNFCRGKPQPSFESVAECIPALAKFIYYDDSDVVTDVCWALSYLLDNPSSKIQKIVETGVTKRLVHLLVNDSIKIQAPALRSIGNIVTGNDMLTQHVINLSVLPCLSSLLKHPKPTIRKEACFTISNITAGNKEQIQAVIDEGIIPLLIQILATEKFEVKKEACWAVSNATALGRADQVRYLVEQGCIEPLCNMLTVEEPRIVTVCLEGLRNIMKVGERTRDAINGEYNEYARAVESAGGLDKIEALQTHNDEGVYERAVQILEVYFNADEDDIEAVMPQDSSSQMAFGSTDAPNGDFSFDM